jgi:hypothetical protein
VVNVMDIPYSGDHWLVARGRVCVVRAWSGAGRIDALRQPLPIHEGANRLDIEYSDRCGNIHLTLPKDSPRSRIALLVRGTPEKPTDVYVADVYDDRTAKIDAISPGIYWLWTWTERLEAEGQLGSLGEMKAFGQRATVKARSTVQIKMTPQTKGMVR